MRRVVPISYEGVLSLEFHKLLTFFRVSHNVKLHPIYNILVVTICLHAPSCIREMSPQGLLPYHLGVAVDDIVEPLASEILCSVRTIVTTRSAYQCYQLDKEKVVVALILILNNLHHHCGWALHSDTNHTHCKSKRAKNRSDILLPHAKSSHDIALINLSQRTVKNFRILCFIP